MRIDSLPTGLPVVPKSIGCGSESGTRNDWKRHKIDCSLLPAEPIELPISFVPIEDLDTEVGKARQMLIRVWNEIEVSHLAALLCLLELTPRYMR